MVYRKKYFGKKPKSLVGGILHDLSKQNVDVHHIKLQSEGGSHNKKNIIGLDKFEHQRIHSIYKKSSFKRKNEIRKILKDERKNQLKY